MSERFFDDLARTLARPMPRRRAVRVLGAALVTAAVPGLRPAVALGAGGEGPCSAPGLCPSGEQVCGVEFTLATGAISCMKTCANDLFPVCCRWPGSPPTVQTCMKGQTCGERPGDCVWRCKPGERECNGKCCKPGEVCKNGTCCSSARVCGDTCCPSGKKCAFSNRKRVCCAANRIVTKKVRGQTMRFCCPPGTVNDGANGCCPPNDDQCCEVGLPLDPDGEWELGQLVQGPRAFCVRGKVVKL